MDELNNLKETPNRNANHFIDSRKFEISCVAKATPMRRYAPIKLILPFISFLTHPPKIGICLILTLHHQNNAKNSPLLNHINPPYNCTDRGRSICEEK